MTIIEYLRAAMERCGEALPTDMGRRLHGQSQGRRYVEYLDGEREPTVETLLKLEALCGLSLDEIDPRIHRGMAQVPELMDLRKERRWTDVALAEAIGASREALDRMAARRRLHLRARVSQVIAISDIVEGRLEVHATDGRMREARQDRRGRPKRAPDPRHDGDPFWDAALHAFERVVSPTAAFALRNVGAGEYAAEGDLLAYRLRVEGRGVRMVVRFKQSGVLLMDRVV